MRIDRTVVLISTIFKKFIIFATQATPIGSWLRSTVIPNAENNYSMFNEETDNLLSNNIDPLQLNMDNYEYQMSYHAGGGL